MGRFRFGSAAFGNGRRRRRLEQQLQRTVDTDGNGSINRSEFTANEGKLDPTMNPTFTMMDKDGSNSVDQDEWSAAAKQKLAIAKGCKASDKSWCPCQNNPDDRECQK